MLLQRHSYLRSSEVVSLFLEVRRGLPWVGHMALDLLCQEMEDACQESSLSQCSQSTEDSLTLGRAVTVKRGGTSTGVVKTQQAEKFSIR